MSVLQALAAKAEKDEGEREAALSPELDQPEVEQQTVQQAEVTASGGNAAAFVDGFLRIATKGVQWFVDPRIELTKEDREKSVDEITPALDKHGIGQGGGPIPFQEEVIAGLEVGKLIKAAVVIKAQLNQHDRQEAAQKRAEFNGSQREHPSSEQAQSVSGGDRVRQESDPKAQSDDDSPGWL